MLNFQKNTGFKLSKKTGFKKDGLRFNNKEEASPGTPLFRKKLGEGIKAEANKDGTIFIDASVEPGSAEERQIIAHETRHLTDMKIGKMKYEDDYIKWNGEEYPRKDGFILYNGEWVEEGSKDFPWERMP